MTRNEANPNSGDQETPERPLAGTHYALLGLPPWATAQQIRQAYREKSKLYHPDTTKLPAAIAVTKFQELNEAYATLSSPERRVAYDLKIGYSRFSVIQAPTNLDRPVSRSTSFRSSAYLDPTDRPLSPGEIFALFILGLTFVGCLVLVITIGFTRGDTAFQTFNSMPLEALQPTPTLEQPDESPPANLNGIQPHEPPNKLLAAPDETPQHKDEVPPMPGRYLFENTIPNEDQAPSWIDPPGTELPEIRPPDSSPPKLAPLDLKQDGLTDHT